MNPTLINSRKNVDISIFIFFSFFWLLLVFGTQTIFSGFHLVDDSIYFSYKNEVDHSGFWPAFGKVFREDLKIRFRPATILYYVIIASVFNYSYFFVAAINLLITITSSFFFYKFARNLGLGRFLSVFLVLILYTGNQGSISYWIATNENIGMLFLSLSLYFGSATYFTKSKIGPSQLTEIFFFTIASLCKESFVLLAPAIIFGRFTADSALYEFSPRKYFADNKAYIGLYVLVSAIVIYIIVFIVGINAIHYAGIDQHSFNVSSIGNAIVRLAFTKGYGLALLLPAVFIIFKRKELKKQDKNLILLFLILFLLITIPQIVLYAKTKIFMRYLLPGLLGGAILVIFSLKFFQEKFTTTTLKLFFYAGVLLIFAGNLYLMIKGGWVFAEEGRLNEKIFATVREKTSDKSSILIVGDPVTQSEPVFTLANYLKSPLIERENIYIERFSVDTMALSPLEKETFIDFEKTAGKYMPTAGNRNFNCIIVFPRTQNSFAPHTDFQKFDSVIAGGFSIYFDKKSE